MIEIGRILKDARCRAGMSQTSLAARAGLRQSTLSRIERGHALPELPTLLRLASACGVEVRVADEVVMVREDATP